MISCLCQRRDDAAQGFERGGHVGIFGERAAVMQTDDAAIADTGENAAGNCLRGELPVEADDSPHDASEPEFGLHPAESEPADAVWGAHQRGREARAAAVAILGRGEFVSITAPGFR